MKILFVSNESLVKGSTNSMLTLVNELKSKYDIEVLLPGTGNALSELQKYEIPYKVCKYFKNYRIMGKKKIIEELIKESWNWCVLKYLKKKIECGQYDLIVSNSSAVDIGARIAQKLKIPHVFYIREFMEEDFGIEYRNKERMKKLFESSDKIIFISQAIAQKYTSVYQIKSYEVIYNGVSQKDYYIEGHEILKSKKIQIVQIGTFCDGKGTKKSINLVKELTGNVDFHLTLVGNGSPKYISELEDEIKKYNLKDMITIIPYTLNIREILKQSDVLLMNSKCEGFGRVTVEGMLGGLLVVGRNAGGTKEIITNDFTGVLFRNQQEFVARMIEIDKEREKYKKIAMEGQKDVRIRFSPSYNAERVNEYLTSCRVG